MIGVVKYYDGKRGVGEITRDGASTDLFFYASELERAGLASLSAGDRLSFDVHKDKALARSFAVNLQVL